jgi:hypothetical protein
LVFGAMTVAPRNAKAQDVNQLFNGLVNVSINIQNLTVIVDDVDILSDNFIVVNVEDVLDEVEINVLSELIDVSDVASFNRDILTDILQDFSILDQSQTVIGVLSDQDVVYLYYLRG